jgi:hypothetical protein
MRGLALIMRGLALIMRGLALIMRGLALIMRGLALIMSGLALIMRGLSRASPLICGLFAMRCAARGLVAFARCRWRHAFDGGIFRVGKTKGFIKPLALGWPEGWVAGG